MKMTRGVVGKVGTGVKRGEGPQGQGDSEAIVFFDGECGLCNRFVDFALARDYRKIFRFAPLQGTTFAATGLGAAAPRPGSDLNLEETVPTEKLTSIVLWEGDRACTKSDAVLRVLAGLGGRWRLVRPVHRVPRAYRDWIYDLVAKNRYRWFGKRQTCRVPSAEDRGRFLP